MNGRNDCYIARRSCGCITAIVGDISDLKQMAAVVKVLVEAGLLIERAEAEYTIVTPPGACPHVKAIQVSMFPLMGGVGGNGHTHPSTREDDADEVQISQESIEVPNNNDGGYNSDTVTDEAVSEAIEAAEAAGEAGELVSLEVPVIEPEGE